MKELKVLLRILPHVSIVLSLMFITFCIIDMQNRAMGFLDNGMSRTLILIWAAVSFVIDGALIWYQRHENASAERIGAIQPAASYTPPQIPAAQPNVQANIQPNAQPNVQANIQPNVQAQANEGKASESKASEGDSSDDDIKRALDIMETLTKTISKKHDNK